jgi:methionyl-tRNA formyltransferase
MRIVIVTQDEPFYLPPALYSLCRIRRDDIVALVVLRAFDESLLDTARRLYCFYGSLDFARLCIRYGWAKFADITNGLYPVTRPYSALDVARRHDIRVYRPVTINSQRFVEILEREIRPELLVSVAASQILGQRVLELPPLGCINLHSAPLPRYQGMMPNFWTLLHGEPEASVTVHYMVEKLDAGDIILQRPVPIYPTDSLHNLMVRSKVVGVKALLEAIALVEAGCVQTKPMDTAQATYFSFPTRNDALRLRAQGRRLL